MSNTHHQAETNTHSSDGSVIEKSLEAVSGGIFDFIDHHAEAVVGTTRNAVEKPIQALATGSEGSESGGGGGGHGH